MIRYSLIKNGLFHEYLKANLHAFVSVWAMGPVQWGQTGQCNIESKTGVGTLLKKSVHCPKALSRTILSQTRISGEDTINKVHFISYFQIFVGKFTSL